jgi:carboxymethylenebutenolidase
MIRLRAEDGHELDAYVAEPAGETTGGLVVVQEIFGVTDHIKRVADQFAAQGYKVVAPAMFDRVERNVTLDYAEIEKGREYMRRLQWRDTLCDVEAAANEVRGAGSACVVGYCWGGTVIAAVSVGGPRGRFSPAVVARIARELPAAADGISERLGWRQP